MTITVSGNWKRAMERAFHEGLKATRRVDGSYTVPSVSRPGTTHRLIVDTAGQISGCSDCKGWDQGGRDNPCKHAGAVALARACECGAHLAIERQAPVPVIESLHRGKSQLFRTGADCCRKRRAAEAHVVQSPLRAGDTYCVACGPTIPKAQTGAAVSPRTFRRLAQDDGISGVL
jgi:hypothetical protein